MDTIRTYLDNLFAGLPEDERLIRAKQELLGTMEDKYNSLKAEGKSENEAVGVVISEFGNIDELLEELGVSRNQPAARVSEEDSAVRLTAAEAEDYIRTRRSSGWLIGVGVFLCIFAPALLIAINTLLSAVCGEAVTSTVAVVALLMCVAVAIVLFVVCGTKDSKYENYEKTAISLPAEYKSELERKYESSKVRLGLGVGFGILTILLGVCAVIIGNVLFESVSANELSSSVMLTLIALGVMLICKSAVSEDSYKYLLNIDKKVTVNADGTVRNKRKNRAVAVFEAILWPVVVIAYFIWSFGFGSWGISWILFPIAGILNGFISSAVNAYNGEED